jgi:hypothetical protein
MPMNKLGRILLVVGGLVLVLLVGVLVGRGHRAAPTSEAAAPAEMTITTAAPPAPPPAPLAPLPAPVHEPSPNPVAIPKLAPDLQVQEDAAAVGMTTLDEPDIDAGQTTPASATADPAAAQPQG